MFYALTHPVCAYVRTCGCGCVVVVGHAHGKVHDKLIFILRLAFSSIRGGGVWHHTLSLLFHLTMYSTLSMQRGWRGDHDCRILSAGSVGLIAKSED